MPRSVLAVGPPLVRMQSEWTSASGYKCHPITKVEFGKISTNSIEIFAYPTTHDRIALHTHTLRHTSWHYGTTSALTTHRHSFDERKKCKRPRLTGTEWIWRNVSGAVRPMETEHNKNKITDEKCITFGTHTVQIHKFFLCTRSHRDIYIFLVGIFHSGEFFPRFFFSFFLLIIWRWVCMCLWFATLLLYVIFWFRVQQHSYVVVLHMLRFTWRKIRKTNEKQQRKKYIRAKIEPE